MELSRDAKIVAGIILLSLPTVQYGGLAILRYVDSRGGGYGRCGSGLECRAVGVVSGRSRTRGGVAHSVVGDSSALEAARLPSPTKLLARIAAPVATFGIERWLFWRGV